MTLSFIGRWPMMRLAASLRYAARRTGTGGHLTVGFASPLSRFASTTTMLLPPPPVPVEAPAQDELPAIQPTAINTPQQKQRNGLASEKQMEWVHNIARQRGMTEAEICQTTGVESLDQLTKNQASTFINKYKKD